MAIVIPSSKIYEKQNPKVRDNAIERIEVNAVEISPNNEYNTTVYNKDFYETQETVSNTLVDYEEALALNAGGSTTRNIRCSCGLKYDLKYITIPEILIPKAQKNKLISEIIDKDNEGNNNIKISTVIEHKIYKGATSYQPSTNSFDFEGGSYSIDEEKILYNLKNLNFQNDVSDKVVINLSTTKPYEVNCTHNFVSNENQLKVSSYFKVNSNNNWSPSIIEIDKYVNADLIDGEIFVNEETIDGIDYYRISSIRLCVSASAILTSCMNESTNSVSSISGYTYAPATKIVQNCSKVSLTIYGNTIGIDLNDKTVYINGETQKKVYGAYGNELMQTRNYEKKETELVENTDYRIGTSSNAAQTYFYTSVHLYNKYPLDTYVEYTTPSGTKATAIIKAFSTTHSPAIASTDGFVTINRVYRPLVATTYDYFKQTQEDYSNGKETATIRCSIGDYYDYDSGAKVISVDDTSFPMSFRIYDQVIPMVYNNLGQDEPMSKLKNGSPKVFQVLGRRIFYNGAVWQELYLQEV